MADKKPSSCDSRHARHGIVENIRASRHFVEHPELLDESSSEHLYTEDNAHVDDDLVAREIGDGCLRRPPAQPC